MSFTMTIEIPALDRLCGILENREKSGLVAAIEAEIVAKLKEAAEGGVPRPTFPEAVVFPHKEETAPAPQVAAPESPKPEPTEKPAEPEAPAPAAKPATLADIQRAAAQLRDEGKLQAVKDLFPEFGIRKLSDLKDAQLTAFADRLRGMGAKI